MGLFGKKKLNGLDVVDFDKTQKTTASKKEFLKKSIKTLGKGASALSKGAGKVGRFIVPPKTPEQIEFEKKLRKETQKAHQKEMLKASIKEAKAKAQRQAQSKFNPKQNQVNIDALMRL